MDFTELAEKVVKKELPRRDFIKLAGLYVFCTTFVEPTIDVLSAKVSEITHSLINPNQKDQYDISLIYKLFGDLNENFSFVPGTAHRIHKGRIHPDDKKAASTLERIGLSGVENLEIVNNLFFPENIQGNIVALGSPATNALTTGIMQYRPFLKKPEHGFFRENKTFFDLPFEYYMNGKQLLKDNRIYKRRVLHDLKVGPNWGIYNNIDNQLIIPKTSESGILLNDYLLVTVLPNIYELKGVDTDSKIIIFGGAHGTGTKAIELLLSNNKILKKLVRQTKNIRYWQALIEIDSISYDPQTHEATPFKLSEEAVIVPIFIDEKRILT